MGWGPDQSSRRNRESSNRQCCVELTMVEHVKSSGADLRLHFWKFLVLLDFGPHSCSKRSVHLARRSKPSDVLESLRTLRIGGTLAFTTWALSGPFQLCQLAQSRLPDYPLAPPPQRLSGSWNHPRYVQSQLKDIGYTNVEITPFSFIQEASSAEQMVKKMWHVLMLLTEGWGDERKAMGWKLARSMEQGLRAGQGDGRVAITSVALLITARRDT
jgi:hypothetical protein